MPHSLPPAPAILPSDPIIPTLPLSPITPTLPLSLIEPIVPSCPIEPIEPQIMSIPQIVAAIPPTPADLPPAPDILPSDPIIPTLPLSPITPILPSYPIEPNRDNGLFMASVEVTLPIPFHRVGEFIYRLTAPASGLSMHAPAPSEASRHGAGDQQEAVQEAARSVRVRTFFFFCCIHLACVGCPPLLCADAVFACPLCRRRSTPGCRRGHPLSFPHHPR